MDVMDTKSATVTIQHFTVIAVKYRATSKSAMNWWLRRFYPKSELTADGVPFRNYIHRNPENDDAQVAQQVAESETDPALHDQCMFSQASTYRVPQSQDSIKVMGLLPFVTSASLNRFFSNCGAVTQVILIDNSISPIPKHLPRYSMPTGARSAIICFADKRAVNVALNLPFSSDSHVLYKPEVTPVRMTRIWSQSLMDSYNVDVDYVTRSCTDYMEAYTNNNRKRLDDNRQAAQEPDEDGWITVKRTHFYAPPKAYKEDDPRSKIKIKKPKTILHFYKARVSDAKMERLRDLKAKFEEDKQKISAMKQQRQFRPY